MLEKVKKFGKDHWPTICIIVGGGLLGGVAGLACVHIYNKGLYKGIETTVEGLAKIGEEMAKEEAS